MPDRLKLGLVGVWLIASVSALVLPIFLPSYVGSSGFRGNALAVSTLTMFILSFPSSVVAVPLLVMLYALLGVATSSLGAAYLNVIVLFFVGLIQWFWMLPRFLERQAVFQRLELGDAVGNSRLFARDVNSWLDAGGSTPLERVLVEDSTSREADLQ